MIGIVPTNMMRDLQLEPVDRRPNVWGVAGEAWKVDLAAAVSYVPEEWKATTAAFTTAWLITAPCYHAIFHSYVIEVVDMARYSAAVGSVHISVPEATHELHVFSLIPDVDRSQFLKDVGCPQKLRVPGDAMDGKPKTKPKYPRLHPINFCAQLLTTVEDINAKVARDVMSILGGHINPDSDGARMWISMYGDAMAQRRSEDQ